MLLCCGAHPDMARQHTVMMLIGLLSSIFLHDKLGQTLAALPSLAAADRRVEVVSAVLLFSPFKRIAGVALALVLAALAYAEMRNDRPQYLQQCGLACGSVVVCAAGSGRPRPPARKPANKQK
eukprot:TRINITY_DN898_c0_g1_i1.p1 TRINITY_DN898_c0_g1~~TRINITY_DN898_c0_g1_i1.p1  ORF type:complete len:123 (-),score=28.40 TRINITY_DN898_c0_g1_i1:431-799(-)